MSVELVINKQLETQTSQYSQVYLPGGVITGVVRYTNKNVDAKSLNSAILVKGVEKCFTGMPHYRLLEFDMDCFFDLKVDIDSEPRINQLNNECVVEWDFSLTIPINLTPCIILYENIAGIYYLMAGSVTLENNDPVRSKPDYLVIEGIHKTKADSLIDKPVTENKSICTTMKLYKQPGDIVISASLDSENLFIGSFFNLKLELRESFLIRVSLVQNLSIHSPKYSCDNLASHLVVSKRLSAPELDASKHPDGYYPISLRIPSSRLGIESVASCTMKLFSVNHFIIVTVYNSLFSTTEVKIPVLLWPKKIN